MSRERRGEKIASPIIGEIGKKEKNARKRRLDPEVKRALR